MIEPNFNKTDGLIPAIVQDAETKDILMLAYMNRASWEATLQSGKATFWSRSRKKLWLKGEISGHVQIVRDIFIDCDEDTLLLQVDQLGGAACHTGHRSCFFRKREGGDFVVVGKKVFDPKEVYK
jgi:phosphoribosyl-AMP cyclohydrolase